MGTENKWPLAEFSVMIKKSEICHTLARGISTESLKRRNIQRCSEQTACSMDPVLWLLLVKPKALP